MSRKTQHDLGNRSAFRFPTPRQALEFTGERYVSGLVGDIQSEHYHRYLFALRFCAGRDVLDIASGEGYGCALLGQVARSVVGIDVDAASVLFGNTHYMTERVSFRRGDATGIPMADASVDAVVSFETIEHVRDHGAFIREIRRVLRPGGVLVMSSPDRRLYTEEAGHENPFHLHELDRGEFLAAMAGSFRHAVMLEQRSMAGSVIMRAAETGHSGPIEGFSTPDGTLFERGEGVPEAPYLLAVCSDAPLPPVASSIMQTPVVLWQMEEMRQRAEKAADDAREATAAAMRERDLLRGELDALAGKHQATRQERDALLAQRDGLRAETARMAAERKTAADQQQAELNCMRGQVRALAAELEVARGQARTLATQREAGAVRLQQVEQELATAQMRLEVAENTLHQVVTSTIWRATGSLRSTLSHYPKARRLGRRALRVVWWTVSGQLPGRLRQRRDWRTQAERLRASGGFDPAFYLDRYPDVAQAGIDPLWHYVVTGKTEGRLPQAAWHAEAERLRASGGFDPAYYLDRYLDVAQAGLDPLWHYVVMGKAEGRLPQAAPERRLADLARQAPPASDPANFADGQREWLTYAPMRQRLAEERAKRLAQVLPEAQAVLDLDEGQVETALEGLAFPVAPQPVISIIVPAFNNLKLTAECLLSIQRCSGSDVAYEVILADDASTDRTAELMSRVPGLVHHRNAANLHFLRNCNAAAKVARGEFVLFLNNDVQVTEGWLGPLVRIFREQLGVGAAGSRIVYPSGHLQEAGVLIAPDCSAVMVGLNDDPALPQYGFARKVDYCSGAALMVERARFEALGGFNEALAPAYCEDMELCLRLRAQGLDTWYVPQSTVVHHLSRTTAQGTAPGDDAGKLRMIVANQQKVSELWQHEVDKLNEVRLFAFYLPQFHPIPENDRWWGKGFTEWTNVTRAVPQFSGHLQPQLPGPLGFYDLRTPGVMEAQAELARRYGIEAFCFYYYWFGGKRLLETPLEAMLASGEPDFPFFLCWANENWTRRWDGQESEVLIGQQHSPEDDAAVIRDLIRYMRDRRYVRVDGRPMLLVYRVDLFPSFAETARHWREICREEGIGEIYLAAVESFGRSRTGIPPAELGCDATVQFPPHGDPVPSHDPERLVADDFHGIIYDYDASAVQFAHPPRPAATRFPAVMAGWDNTARRMGRATVFHGATPGTFQAWLEEAIRVTREHNAPGERIVFINAWNEWAEGAQIEPDKVFGHGRLEAVRNALASRFLQRD